jgi:hypothetical protein
MSEEKDYVLIFEAPKIVPPEFRLYYDDKGKVITYTCEKLDGKYIVIDALTFAEARPDVRVVDGKLTSSVNSTVIAKLTPDLNEGVVCAEEDVSIIVADSYTGNTTKWKLQIYEC